MSVGRPEGAEEDPAAKIGAEGLIDPDDAPDSPLLSDERSIAGVTASRIDAPRA